MIGGRGRHSKYSKRVWLEFGKGGDKIGRCFRLIGARELEKRAGELSAVCSREETIGYILCWQEHLHVLNRQLANF